MYDVNEDNILLLLLFFGVVAINLLLFNSYSRTPTQQLVLLMGSFFSPTLASFFVASFVFHKKNVVLSQKYSTPKTQLTKTHLFLIKNTIYTALLSSSSSLRFWGHRGTTLEEIYNNNSDNEWWYLPDVFLLFLLSRKDETDAHAQSTRVFG